MREQRSQQWEKNITKWVHLFGLTNKATWPKSLTITLACENSLFSTLLAAGDVPRGGTSATQRQKFHTDDVNQCLHNKSGSHGVPNANLFNFTFLLVNFGKDCVQLRTNSSKTQMLLLEKNIFYKYWLFYYRFLAFTFHFFSLLSVIRKQ